MENKPVRIYDGAAFCADCSACPVVDLYPHEDRVVIHDPTKPESGSFTMTTAEYRALLENAKRV